MLSSNSSFYSGSLLPILLISGLILLYACYPNESINVPVKSNDNQQTSALDDYIQTAFIDPYGVAVKYKFEDRFVDPSEKVSPPSLSNVRPMLDFIQQFWIEPYLEVDNGETFFENHVPAEVVLLGGLIFNDDGTVTLGTADAGAKITITDVNSIDPSDSAWRTRQLQTIYHEFAHTVHQRYKLPNGFETISPTGYTSAGSWFTLTDEEALLRGFTSPYATSSPNEDFAETVAYYLFDKNFDAKFISLNDSCIDNTCQLENEGKEKIAAKLNAIREHYQRVTGVNLFQLRNVIQQKI